MVLIMDHGEYDLIVMMMMMMMMMMAMRQFLLPPVAIIPFLTLPLQSYHDAAGRALSHNTNTNTNTNAIMLQVIPCYTVPQAFIIDPCVKSRYIIETEAYHRCKVGIIPNKTVF